MSLHRILPSMLPSIIPGRAKVEASSLPSLAKEAYSSNPKDVGGYKLVEKTPTLLLYKKGNSYTVSVRGTADFRDVKADANIPFNRLNQTDRYKHDLETIKKFKQKHPGNYTAVGHSLGGAIVDEFIREGLVTSGTSYNPAVQLGNIRPENKRIHASGDPLHIPLLGSTVVHRKTLNAHSLENFDTE